MLAKRLPFVVLALVGAGVSPASTLASPPDAELVTVTPTSFVATWTTAAPADSTVCVDDRPCVSQGTPTRFHRVEVTGLAPGTRYRYVLKSAGVAQDPSATNPGTFTTLVRPPGKHLFDFAIVSDVHIGEGCSGTAVTAPQPVGSVPPCFQALPGEPPYADAMASAAVAELNGAGIRLTIINADNTSRGDYEQVERFKQIWEGLDGEWRVARGAHDRAGQSSGETRCGPDKDCFRTLLFPDRPSGRIYESFDFGGYRFIGLDSAKPGDGSGDLTDPAQMAFLEKDLESARKTGRKTFVYFHHPVSEYANLTSFPPLIFGVRTDQGRRQFLDLMAKYPNVVGVFNAHTHRNYVSYEPTTGVELPFIENGPTKEYPGGYSVIRVYEGGYMRNFNRLRCEQCLSWISRTRDEYAGLYPGYTLGTLSSRNFSHLYGCGVPTPPPSPPTGNESAIGGDTFRPACPSPPAQDPPPPGGGGSTGGGSTGGGAGGGDQPAGGNAPGGSNPPGGTSPGTSGSASGETVAQRRSPRRCHIPRFAQLTGSGLEALRLGDTVARMATRAGVPNRRRAGSLRYCVVRGGLVRVGLSRGRAVLIASGAGGHRSSFVHPGTTLRGLLLAYPAARRISARHWSTGPRQRLVFGVRDARVRTIGVVTRSLAADPRLLQRHMRRLGL